MNFTGGNILRRRNRKCNEVGVQWLLSRKELSVFKERQDTPKGKRKSVIGRTVQQHLIGSRELDQVQVAGQCNNLKAFSFLFFLNEYHFFLNEYHLSREWP